MKTHDLGDSTLSVTPLGLGLAALGRPGYINIGHETDLGADRDARALESRTHHFFGVKAREPKAKAVFGSVSQA